MSGASSILWGCVGKAQNNREFSVEDADIPAGQTILNLILRGGRWPGD
jgi:hypothetical protein